MLKHVFQDFHIDNISAPKAVLRSFIDRGASAVIIHRISTWFYQRKMKPIAVIIKQVNILINSCDIAVQAKIGAGFKVYHGLGIVISDCEIGQHFSVYQNVTIGNKPTPGTDRTTPVIGNGVSLLVGSVVIGAITIGNNVRVGANAVVLKDVPSNATAVGVPARIL